MRHTWKLMRVMESLGVLLMIGTLSGCSALMVAVKPEPKNMEVLGVGTPRIEVLKEFGQPVETGLGDGNRVDTFKYQQGEPTNKKLGHAALHGGMDLITFGVWELFATPMELMNLQPDITVEVMYDERDRVATAGPPVLRWVKAGSTREDFQRANAECRQAAPVPAPAPTATAGAVPLPAVAGDQPLEKQTEALYQDCMWARGFELNRRLPGR